MRKPADGHASTQGRSFATAFECPVCGVGYNKETAIDKGFYCGCTSQLIFMRKVRL